MTLPEIYEILVVTLSDRASRGEYEDLSGPEAGRCLEEYFRRMKKRIRISFIVIPDKMDELREILLKAKECKHIIITTGGTGIGPHDITIDVVKPLLDKEIPGIMELIRIKYGLENPNALLSRAVAGLMGKSLIYTLPGSRKAVGEYMKEITKTLEHTIYMQYGIDMHHVK